jgi:hypothetical protein
MAIRKDYEGKTYIIAVNATRQQVKPTITLDPAPAEAAQVLKEGRTVTLQKAAFSDVFDPLAVHIYMLVK